MPQLIAGRHAIEVFATMVPPRFGTSELEVLPLLLCETCWIALTGTLGGALGGLSPPQAQAEQ